MLTQYELEFLLVLGRRLDKLNTDAGGRRAFHDSKLIANRTLQADHAHPIACPPEIDFIAGAQFAPRRQETPTGAKTSDLIVVLTLRSPTPIGKEIYVNAWMSSLFD